MFNSSFFFCYFRLLLEASLSYLQYHYMQYLKASPWDWVKKPVSFGTCVSQWLLINSLYLSALVFRWVSCIFSFHHQPFFWAQIWIFLQIECCAYLHINRVHSCNIHKKIWTVIYEVNMYFHITGTCNWKRFR